MLLNYQHTVQALLKTRNFPGISIQQLEKFKHDFRSVVFTCRFNCCPLGQTGFDSDVLRDEHERTHTPTVSCEVPGCRYPPFPSAQALKNHCAKYHDLGMPRIRIKPTGEPQKRRHRTEDVVHAKKFDSIEPGVTIASEMRIRPGPATDSSTEEPLSDKATTLSDEGYLDRVQAIQAVQIAAPQAKASLSAQQAPSHCESPEPDTPYYFYDQTISHLGSKFIPAENFEVPGIIRLKVYELRGNDWLHIGTGMCTCGYSDLVCHIYLEYISLPNVQLGVTVPRFRIRSH